MPDTPAPDRLALDPAAVPPEGALGLLALGYRGLDAWRAARGSGWMEERQREWEAYEIRQAARAAATPPETGADAPDSPPAA